MVIAFASYIEFKLFQIDVKSTFLNCYLNKKVYMKQLLGFESLEHPHLVYKLDKDCIVLSTL